VNSMGEKVKISRDSVLWEVALRVKDKSMQAILNEAEDKKSCDGSQDESEEVESFPRGHLADEVEDHQAWEDGYYIPFIVT